MSLRLSERQYAQLVAGKAVTAATKFPNKKEREDGILFDSRFEASHYRELKLRIAAGEIRNLRMHVPFPLIVNGAEVCRYVADFVYEELAQVTRDLLGHKPHWERVIEDTKSEPTRRRSDYRIKKKLMAALGMEIREVMMPIGRKRRRRPRRR